MAHVARPFIETETEFTDEEVADITARAKSIGLDMNTYIRVRAVTAGELPDPVAFLPLMRRLAAFATDYEANLRAYAAFSPAALGQSKDLAKTFAQLLQDWDDLYGPR